MTKNSYITVCCRYLPVAGTVSTLYRHRNIHRRFRYQHSCGEQRHSTWKELHSTGTG